MNNTTETKKGCRKCPDKQKVILFGAGGLGEFAFSKLNKEYEIVAYCDNNKDILGNEKNGIEIISFEKMKHFENVMIIITSSYREEISKQLFENDIRRFKIFSKNNDKWKVEKFGLTKNIHDSLIYIANVKGFLSVSEQIFLIHLPALINNIEGDYVEIGSFKGKSATCFGLGNNLFSSIPKKIFCVDPFQSDIEKNI